MFQKNCPICGEVQIYKGKNAEGNYLRSLKENKICRQCSHKKRSENMRGEKNHFFGKKHKKEIIDFIRNHQLEIIDNYKTKEFREIMSKAMTGIKNPHKGKTMHQMWEEKHGKEYADQRNEEHRKRLSLATSGENNPMYGKPSPMGSGNGWSGWYKGWYFRSLMELSYMITEIEDKRLEWKSAETKDMSIEYIDEKGDCRNYFADFLIEDRLIEIKPKILQKTLRNIAKRKGAEKFCESNGLKYEMVDCEKISFDKLKSLVESKQVIFLDRYQEKYEKYKQQYS
jgi:hypothetical protein